jgi:hypothetical protein
MESPKYVQTWLTVQGKLIGRSLVLPRDWKEEMRESYMLEELVGACRQLALLLQILVPATTVDLKLQEC